MKKLKKNKGGRTVDEVNIVLLSLALKVKNLDNLVVENVERMTWKLSDKSDEMVKRVSRSY